MIINPSKDEAIVQITYGKNNANDNVCHPNIVTNKRTLGPFGPDSNLDIFGQVWTCPETYVVDVPQDQDFESWFASNAQFPVQDLYFMDQIVGTLTYPLQTFTGAVGMQ